MTVLLFYALLAGWVFFSIIIIARFTHLLQMEHYHTDSYLKWVLDGGGIKIFSPGRYDKPLHIFSIVIAISIYFSAHRAGLEQSFLVAVPVYWIINNSGKRNLKKAFVITSRVKRLFVILFIIEALSFTLVGNGRAVVSFIVLFAYIQPFFIALANLVSTPVERFLQRGFTKSASAKLAGKKVIAVTGSYGKTGTKEAVAHILETAFPLLKTPGSYNTPMGLCKVVNEKMEPYHELFVTEMGATRRGDIKELCGIAHPSIAVITATGEAHLETFKTVENVAKTKFELADALPDDGLLIYNSDYDAAREIAKGRTQKTITYGFNEGADYTPKNIECSKDGSFFDLATPDGEIKNIRIKLLGKLNVINVTAAFVVGTAVGISPEKLRSAAATLPQMESRLQIIENRGSYLIINDGFNSNIHGAAVAVETLSYFEGYRKILVTPGIVDIGDSHDTINFEFGRTAAKYCDDVLLINERRTASLRNGLLAGKMAKLSITTFDTLAGARKFLDELADEKTVVLFENDLPDHMEKF